jgi:hypothetical protein
MTENARQVQFSKSPYLEPVFAVSKNETRTLITQQTHTIMPFVVATGCVASVVDGLITEDSVAQISQRMERALSQGYRQQTTSNSGRPSSVILLRMMPPILTSVFWFRKLRAFSFDLITPFQRPICASTLLR